MRARCQRHEPVCGPSRVGDHAREMAWEIAPLCRRALLPRLTTVPAPAAAGDGEISKKEFRRAMPALGLEVPERDIDSLFDEWDKDGGGSLDFKELQKILRAPPPAKAELGKVSSAISAASKLKAGLKKGS